MKTLRERFESKYIPEPNTGCWLWAGASCKKGYGIMSLPGHKKMMRAHRVSYLIHNGALDHKDLVCHKCDTPACVNPDHLFLGSHQDNMNDMLKKGRQAKGENCRTSKLTAEEVLEIRRQASTKTQAQIARDFGVSPGYIWGLLKGLYWRHV